MSKEEKINQLVDELLALEPELKNQETTLRQTIASMLELDDKIRIDETFKRNLKAKLLETTPQKQFTINSLFMNKLHFALASIVLIAVGAFGTTVYYKKDTLTAKDAIQLFSSETKITQAGKNAFGSLSSTTNVSQNTAESVNTVGSSNAALPTQTSEKRVAPDSGGYGGGSDASIAPYEPYTYVYKGEKITLNENEGDVFKRIRNTGGSKPGADVLKAMSLGLININKFQNIGLQSYTLIEDRDFGYMVTVNTQEANAYINENWERWSSPDRLCQDEACFDRYRIKPEDVPQDSELIKIADDFLKEYGINRKGYGDGVVQKPYEGPITIQERSSIYIPDVIGVVYPLKIQNQTVSDEGGYPSGMYVSVNIRHKKVSSVSDIASQSYQSSQYPLETDFSRILKFAEHGGYLSNEATSQSKNQIYLGTPSKVLIRAWTYSPTASQELFVPALSFPVTGTNTTTQNYYAPKVVVIPLVKELLDQRTYPTPIPLDKPLLNSAE